MIAAHAYPIELTAKEVAYTTMVFAGDELRRLWTSSLTDGRAVARLTATEAGRRIPKRLPYAEPWRTPAGGPCAPSATSRLVCLTAVRPPGGEWVARVKYDSFKLVASIRAEVTR